MTWWPHLKKNPLQSHIAIKLRTLCLPLTKGPFFCSDSQQNMTLPWTPCVQCLVIMPTARYEAVQNKWRQQERASIKRELCLVIFFGTFVTACVTCANCFHLRSEKVSSLSSKWGHRQSLPCVSIVSPVCWVATTSLLVYSTNTRVLTPLLCLPVNSTDISG